MDRIPPMNTPAFAAQCGTLLAEAGYDERIQDVQPLTRGGNNKVWCIKTKNGRYLTKQYFRHTADSRDRLSVEFEFTRYAHAIVPHTVSCPIARDPINGFAIFQFLSGKPFAAGEIGDLEVLAASDFFAEINDRHCRVHAAHLPNASEACFSIIDHLALVRNRIQQLQAAFAASAIDVEARTFVAVLWNRWQTLEGKIIDNAYKHGLMPDAELPTEQRCISPSDFGFHNALRDEDGTIRFIDFEYAGWDDPAKMIGDFFAQLAVPVPAYYFDAFAEKVLNCFPGVSLLMVRARLLRLAYQVKWCCIALNVFHPVNLARRKFANPDLDECELKRVQLAKAQTLFHSLILSNHGLH